jgi:hypothetical protein
MKCSLCSIKILEGLLIILGLQIIFKKKYMRRRKLPDDLKEMRGYSHLKEEALDRPMWRARFGKGFGTVVRQTTK